MNIYNNNQLAQVSISARAQRAQVDICTKAQQVIRGQWAQVSTCTSLKGSAGYEGSVGSCFHLYVYIWAQHVQSIFGIEE